MAVFVHSRSNVKLFHSTNYSGDRWLYRYFPFPRTSIKFFKYVFHNNIFVQDPVSPQNWTTVRNCTSDGMSCFQPANMFQTEILSVVGMSEDCLFLNVYSPEVRVKLIVLTLITTLIRFQFHNTSNSRLVKQCFSKIWGCFETYLNCM